MPACHPARLLGWRTLLDPGKCASVRDFSGPNGASPMYTPPAFRVEETAEIHALMRAARSATLVTATADGLKGTLLPMLIDTTDGPFGTLYAHLARANDQWRHAPLGEALAIFNGPEAYISPN